MDTIDSAIDGETLDDLRNSVRAVLARHAETNAADAVIGNDAGDDQLWAQIGALGWLGTITEPRHGGSGLGLLAATTIVDELAYHSTCVPFISSAVMATTALQCSNADTADAWLPKLAVGNAVGAFGCTGRSGIADSRLVDVVALTEPAGHVILDGIACFVADAAFADVLLIIARSPQGELFAVHVDPEANGVGIEPVPTINRGYRLAHVRVTGVRVSSSEILARGDHAQALFDRVMARALVVLAADAHGTARRAFDLALDYSTRRHQFDRPIGSFQAIKHKLADMYTSITASAACVRAAASALDRDDPRSGRHVAAAGSFVRQAASQVVGASMQIHGAIGYTWEHECHLLLKRAKFDERYLVSGWAARDHLAGLALNDAAAAAGTLHESSASTVGSVP